MAANVQVTAVRKLTIDIRPRVGASLVVVRVDGDNWSRTVERRLRDYEFEDGFAKMLDEIEELVIDAQKK